MNIQSVKGVLFAITASMVASFMLMPQVAFSQGVQKGIPANSCTFLDLNGDPTVTVYGPDNIKVVSTKNNLKATCNDDSLKIESGPRIVFEGSNCGIGAPGGFGGGPYKQVIDNKSTTLTCKAEVP